MFSTSLCAAWSHCSDGTDCALPAGLDHPTPTAMASTCASGHRIGRRQPARLRYPKRQPWSVSFDGHWIAGAEALSHFADQRWQHLGATLSPACIRSVSSRLSSWWRNCRNTGGWPLIACGERVFQGERPLLAVRVACRAERERRRLRGRDASRARRVVSVAGDPQTRRRQTPHRSRPPPRHRDEAIGDILRPPLRRAAAADRPGHHRPGCRCAVDRRAAAPARRSCRCRASPLWRV